MIKYMIGQNILGDLGYVETSWPLIELIWNIVKGGVYLPSMGDFFSDNIPAITSSIPAHTQTSTH